MKHAVFLTLCLALLVEVCAKGKGGSWGSRVGGSKSGWFSGSSSSSSSSKGTSSSSSKGTSSSSGGKTGSKSTTYSTPNKHVKDLSGRGWGEHYPTRNTNTNWRQQNNNPYPYWNPNNQIMSPRYSGNYAYGAYGRGYGQGGSPFAHKVQSMGYNPSVQSQGFGQQAVVAAGTGAVAGMAVGYGLGSFPRPHYHFHDSNQESSYNHYMYQHYGSQETRNTNKRTHTHGQSSAGSGAQQGIGDSSSSGGTNSYDDDNRPLVLLKSPPESYGNYMSTCMKRRDLLQSERTGNQTQSQNMTKAGAPSTTAMPEDAANPSQEVKKGAGQENETEEKGAEKKEEHDEVVSILEIGYPALIEQLKARKCVKLYTVYTQEVAKKQYREQQAYNHSAKPAGVHFISSSLLCLMGSLLLY
ncbi:uncharacterized protein DDB_G0271670-like [Alosa sapidissima]|uniref:uncharacterized protein DDB_G0271670-like n=1 Tax=Alosa sapidissima TaxID=34773 RepID=UPI001C0855FF|nr:uncharacterized protein DDB_G0271670-like [Alosa sapidissima]